MNEFEQQTKQDDCAIIKFEGTPSTPEASGEGSRWQRFLNAIWPFTQKGGRLATHGYDLGKAYAEAEVAKKANEAAKTAAEAAEIAARAEVSRNESCRIFNEEVDGIFQDDSLPQAAKMLKLAKLLDTNPDISAQFDRVADIMNQLQTTRGTAVEISPRLNKFPVPQDEAPA